MLALLSILIIVLWTVFLFVAKRHISEALAMLGRDT